MTITSLDIRIYLNGDDITDAYAGAFTNISYTDSLHDAVDLLTITYADIDLDVSGDIGYGNLLSVEIGEFPNVFKTGVHEVDSIRGKVGKSNPFTINCISVQSLNSTFKRKMSFDFVGSSSSFLSGSRNKSRKINFVTMMNAVLKTSGYAPAYSEDVEKIAVPVQSFKSKTRGEIIQDVIDEYNIFVKIYDSVGSAKQKTVFFYTKEYFKNKPSIIFDKNKDVFNDFSYEYNLTEPQKVAIKNCEIHLNKNDEIEAYADINKDVTSELIPEHVMFISGLENNDCKKQAVRKADSASPLTVTINTMGRVDLVAGNVIELINFTALLNRRYYIAKADHNINKQSGWTVDLELFNL